MSKEALQARNEAQQDREDRSKCPATRAMTDRRAVHDVDSAIGTYSMESQTNSTRDAEVLEGLRPPKVNGKLVNKVTCENEKTNTHESLPPDTQAAITSCHGNQNTDWNLTTNIHTAVAEPVKRSSNVFERLSAPRVPEYRITARQRTKARLSLKLADSQQHSPTIRRRTVTKTQLPKLRPERCKTAKPSASSEANESLKQELRPRTSHDWRERTYSHPIRPETDDDGPFEITPLYYDSRYSAMRYGGDFLSHVPNADDEESWEIIRQSKIKCTQWLMNQMSLVSARNK